MATGSVSLPNGSITTGLDTVTYTTVITTNLQVTNIKALDGTASASVADTTGAWTFSKPITVSDTTQSTSTTTGAIVTAGGLGVAKNVTVGGIVAVPVGSAAAPSIKVGSTQSGFCETVNTRLGITSAGALLVEFSTVGATGNYLIFSANNTPTVGAQGPGADVNLGLAGKGAGDVFAVTGGLGVSTVGKGLKVAEGSNAKQGVATLVGGTVTVSNTAVTANSRIFLTSQVDGGTPGFVRVSARVAATSFTITSSDGADTSTIAYEIFEPTS